MLIILHRNKKLTKIKSVEEKKIIKEAEFIQTK